MTYAAILCFFAGALTGSIFNVRTLLMALAIFLAGSAILSLVQGPIDGLCALGNVLWIEVGYFAGIYGRYVFDDAVNSRRNSDA